MRPKAGPVTRVTSRDISHMKIFGITPRACRSPANGQSAFKRVRVLTHENDTNQIEVPWDNPPK